MSQPEPLGGAPDDGPQVQGARAAVAGPGMARRCRARTLQSEISVSTTTPPGRAATRCAWHELSSSTTSRAPSHMRSRPPRSAATSFCPSQRPRSSSWPITRAISTPRLLISVLPPRLRHSTIVAGAADYFFDRRWKAHLWAFLTAAIPIERQRVNRKSADLAAEMLEEGWNLLIYPEGGRSPDGWMQDVPPGRRIPRRPHRAGPWCPCTWTERSR